jgi:hypothetical protein
MLIMAPALVVSSTSCNLVCMINRFSPERSPHDSRHSPGQLEHHSPQSTRFPPGLHLKIWLFAGGTLVAVSAGIIIFVSNNKNGSPLSPSLEQAAGFPIFAPSKLPQGIFYAKKPATLSRGLVTYSLTTAHGTVVVIEQAAPANPPDFSNISAFTSTSINAGTNYTGSSGGRTVDIISSNTTLISISADHSVPNDQVLGLARSMASLPD